MFTLVSFNEVVDTWGGKHQGNWSLSLMIKIHKKVFIGHVNVCVRIYRLEQEKFCVYNHAIYMIRRGIEKSKL